MVKHWLPGDGGGPGAPWPCSGDSLCPCLLMGGVVSWRISLVILRCGCSKATKGPDGQAAPPGFADAPLHHPLRAGPVNPSNGWLGGILE